jgi:hypothetical protein
VAALAIASIAATYLYFANFYMPLQVVGGGPDSSAGSRFVRIANGEFGTAQTLVYCSAANGRFAVSLSIVNTGSFPITILGGDPGPGGPATDHTNVNGFALADLAAYRSQLGDGASAPTDPSTAAPIATTTLDPSHELDVWARFETGPQPLQANSSMTAASIWIRYSTFGIARTAELPIYDQIAVTGDCGH